MATEPLTDATADAFDAEPAKSVKRLTRAQIASAIALRETGKSTRDIAQVIGCHHATVARTLALYVDMRPPARKYLESNALKMARNVVRHGRASDHVKTLQGIGVLEQDHASGITIQVGSPSTDPPPMITIDASPGECRLADIASPAAELVQIAE